MTKFEKMYSFEVIDEIAKGTDVFIIDRNFCNSTKAIRKVNDLCVVEVINITSLENENNRYEFYKVVTKDE